MPKPTKTTQRSDQRNSRGEQRRRRIFKSLHDCILAQGYVKTTLADVAKGADMSASHLLYYFKGKEAILEQYFENVSDRFLEKISAYTEQEPEQQIHSLADFWFRGEAGTVKEIGFMLECFGAAVNDEVLKVTKAEFDAHCKAFLAKTFEACPSIIIGDSKDAAEIGYGLMIGLRSAVYFDDDIDLEDAHRLFVQSMLTMGGLR